MQTRIFRLFKRNDNAISAVIGSILMVAVTVALVASVYTAVNGFGSKSLKEPTGATFRMETFDLDGDGMSDSIKVTYLTGPSSVATTISVLDATGTAVDLNGEAEGTDVGRTFTIGSSYIYDAPAAGTYHMSVNGLGQLLVEGSAVVQE